MFHAPVVHVLHHLEPRTGLELLPVLRQPGELPQLEQSLDMRHGDDMTAVYRTKAGNTMGTSVWIERILLCNRAVFIHIAHRRKIVTKNPLQDLISALKLTLAVSHNDGKNRLTNLTISAIVLFVAPEERSMYLLLG